jgi:hypothetical protein
MSSVGSIRDCSGGTFPVWSGNHPFQPNAPIIGNAEKGPWLGSPPESPGPHFLVTVDAGSDGYGMNGSLVPREKLNRVAGTTRHEHPISLACKNRLRYDQDTEIVSNHENGEIRAIIAFRLHTNRLF